MQWFTVDPSPDCLPNKSNLIWTSITLILHQLTDSKAQLNKVNKCESNIIAWSYQRRHRGDRKAMEDRLS